MRLSDIYGEYIEGLTITITANTIAVIRDESSWRRLFVKYIFAGCSGCDSKRDYEVELGGILSGLDMGDW